MHPEFATVMGPVKVIPREFPEMACSCIDVEFPQPGQLQTERLLNQLVAECQTTSPDSVVALRGKHRWVQTFDRVETEDRPHQPSRLRERGVYLITGGLGGIGLELAEHLARSVQARLVLVGRSELPQKTEWASWLETHAESDLIARRIRKVQAMERLGSEVMIAQADVANLNQMREIVAVALQRFGPINGVIHSAGIAGGGMIQLKTREAAAKVLAPKVGGTMVLDALFKDTPLDFLVLC